MVPEGSKDVPVGQAIAITVNYNIKFDIEENQSFCKGDNLPFCTFSCALLSFLSVPFGTWLCIIGTCFFIGVSLKDILIT